MPLGLSTTVITRVTSAGALLVVPGPRPGVAAQPAAAPAVEVMPFEVGHHAPLRVDDQSLNVTAGWRAKARATRPARRRV